MYNVPIRTIKNTNGLVTDQIFQLREILIPVTPSTNLGGAVMAPKTAEQILNEQLKKEEFRREAAVYRMNSYLVQRINDPKVGTLTENYRSEALYYCEQFDFDFDKAKAAFEADFKFE